MEKYISGLLYIARQKMFHKSPLSKLWKSKVERRSWSKRLVGPGGTWPCQNLIECRHMLTQSIPVLHWHMHLSPEGSLVLFILRANWLGILIRLKQVQSAYTWCELIWKMFWWAVQKLGREHCQYRNESLTPSLSSANLAQSLILFLWSEKDHAAWLQRCHAGRRSPSCNSRGWFMFFGSPQVSIEELACKDRSWQREMVPSVYCMVCLCDRSIDW